jgi:hypothetical protein
MPTWLRSIFGLAAGGLNLFANGTNWKQVLLSLAVAGLGIVSHLSSTSDATVTGGKVNRIDSTSRRTSSEKF